MRGFGEVAVRAQKAASSNRRPTNNSPMRGVKVTADLTEVGLARLARVAPRDATALLRAVGRPFERWRGYGWR